MDGARFDAITRVLTAGASRRRLVGSLLLTLLAREAAPPDLAAKGSQRGKKRSKKRGDKRREQVRSEAKPKSKPAKPAKPAKPTPGNADCAAFCTVVFSPGPERGACVSAAARGEPGNLCAACGADPNRLCDGECRDLTSNPNHCGRCGQSCETNGSTCGGACRNGACAFPGAETACGPAPTCADGMATSRGRCDGEGGCTSGETTTCAPYRCGNSACRETCGNDDDCLGNAYCTSDSRCAGDEADGQPCQHGGGGTV